jgi:DHA3 family macrolide efflux protein-like MFS transporter
VKTFFTLWSSQASSLFGSAVVNFALAWYLTRETGSATVLATAIMVAMLPQIILGPFVGPLVDRWSRKKIMIYADLYTALLTVAFVILFHTNSVQIWHIYLIMIGRGIGETLQFPALAASIPMIVPEKQLVRANRSYPDAAERDKGRSAHRRGRFLWKRFRCRVYWPWTSSPLLSLSAACC